MPERVALISGAARGIGRTTAERFAADGWAVVATDLAPTEEASFAHPAIAYRVADVTDAAQMAAVVEEAERRGPLRACVANAGIVGETFEPFPDADPATWERTLRVNVLGVLVTLQAASRAMVRGGGGALLATASAAGVRAEPAIPAYCASKAAVIALVQSLAIELGPHGVTANAVAPGPTLTEMLKGVLAEREAAGEQPGGDAREETASELFARHREEARPLGRLGEPDEVAGAFLWLASDAARYVTGQTIVVDGGGVLI